MKKTKYIKFLVAAMLLGGLATSCMDDDWNDPTGEVAPYGNNDIVEDDAKMISIKELKAKTVDLIPSSQANDTVRITEDWQLKGRVTGNDILALGVGVVLLVLTLAINLAAKAAGKKLRQKN